MNNNGSFLYKKQPIQKTFDLKMQPNGNYTYYDSNDGVFYETDKNLILDEITKINHSTGDIIW